MTTKKLSISPVALTTTDMSVLKVTLGILGNAGADLSILTDGDTSGNIVLVDTDIEAGQSVYQQFKGGRGQTLVALTDQSLNDSRNMVLRKPLRVQTLKDVLYDLHEQATTAAGAGLSLSKPKPAETAKAAPATLPDTPFDADKNLFFVLLKAHQQKQRLQIFYPPHSPMYADGNQGMVATSASRATLRKMVSMPSAQLKTLQLSEADFEILAKGQLIMQFSHVLWSAALFGSQSRLVDGHDLDELGRLKAWPNFSRLDFESSHMALASLMAGQAMSIRQVQEKTGFALETVVGFYNAALVTGLLEVIPTAIDVPAGTPAARADNPKKSGLFAKIARRLNLDQSDNPS